MRIRLEPLITILSYIHRPDPLYVRFSGMHTNNIWISQKRDTKRYEGQCCLYSLDEMETKEMTPDWIVSIYEFKARNHKLYEPFMRDMKDFLKIFPEEIWFIL